jgi:hypothetical protein
MKEIKKIATMNGWYVKPIKKKNSVIGFHFTNATENGFTDWELKDNVIGLGNVMLIDSDSLYFFISEKNRDWFWNHIRESRAVRGTIINYIHPHIL